MVEIPVLLDEAAGLSMVSFQVNYDAAVLQFISVCAGPLGLKFDELAHEVEDGIVRCVLASRSNLQSGQGPLVIMKFRLIDGADESIRADISLADYNFADASGVVAVNQNESSNSTSGSIQATNNRNIDNFRNRLPDWWEDLHDLDKFSMLTAGSDTDGDGACALLEYGLAGNPRQFDASSLVRMKMVTGNTHVLKLSLNLRIDDPALIYSLQTSEDLSDWTHHPIVWYGSNWVIENPAGIRIVSSHRIGDGIWNIVIEQEQGSSIGRFYQTRVER